MLLLSDHLCSCGVVVVRAWILVDRFVYAFTMLYVCKYTGVCKCAYVYVFLHICLHTYSVCTTYVSVCMSHSYTYILSRV